VVRVNAAGAPLAAVIVSRDGRADLLALLDALAAQVHPGDAVLVVDNASADGTPEAVRARPGVRLLAGETNLGYAGGAARGLAAVLAEGFPLALLLNQDVLPEPGALDALRAAAAARPGAGAFQPLLLSAADPARVDSRGIRVLRGLRMRDDGAGSPAAAAPRADGPIFGACGAAILLRAEALRAAGLPDPELFLLFEDVDLAFRLRAEGREAILVPGARFLHRRGVSARPGPALPDRARRFFLHRNGAALALRYWPARWLLPAAPLLAWQMVEALRLAPAAPGHRCLPLWRRYLAGRRASRAALRGRGEDRWFV
jgi:rhamnopyranosyl-N-acetylglucosaminyl-diphospho-decaprenol beta-1,3/1,4-galactofuranosyltransferase